MATIKGSLAIFFLFIGMLSSVEGCPYIRGCTFEDDYCDSLRCNKIVEGHEIVLKFEMNICQDEIAVTVSISVPSLGVYYSHTFDSDQEIPIPGLGLGPLGSVYLKLESYRDETKHFNLKVSIALKLFGRVLKTFTIIDKDLGLLRKSMKCGFFAWLNDQSTGIKAAAYGGFCLVLVSIFSYIACCCYCCCCKKRNQNGHVIFRSAPEASQENLNDISCVIKTI
ncbi:uncharacterized protein LOC135693804 [Rhopilema esculentum]|uniref:uncharacterized protein LOC135693804 n=1 Tax=Rhopilema esculentum TaxID=499914 RepID=UPI0031D5F4F8